MPRRSLGEGGSSISQVFSLAGDFAEQFEDVLLDSFNVGLDRFERPRRLIFVKVAVEIDLVTDFADLAVLVITHRFVDPRFENIWAHFTIEIIMDRFAERDVLGVAQFRIGFGISFRVAADFGGFITF